MTEVVLLDNLDAFLDQFGAQISANPVEHNIILSMCEIAKKKQKIGEKTDIRFAVMRDENGLAAASVQTPPHNLVLSKTTTTALEALAEKLHVAKSQFPGIVGPSDAAASFSDAWTHLTGQKSVEFMDQIIYALKNVLMPQSFADGKMRLARTDEVKIVARWTSAFAKEVLPKSEQSDDTIAEKKAAEKIAAGAFSVWEVDGKAVAQAGISGTSDIARVSHVYTPPEHRGKGYAGALVAHLSQAQLAAGKKMCCLYADAKNPVSNSIYRKIGYEFVGRSSMYILEKNPAA